MDIERSGFGTTRDGQQVSLYKISNSSGAYITVTDYGASLVSVAVPDRDGKLTDVTLGYDSVTGYETYSGHLGAVIGRYGNRIEGGAFNLNGTDYQLALNEGGHNNLHSGPDGYEYRMWQTAVNEQNGCVAFSLHSPDGDQGFPGSLDVTVTYKFTEDNRVTLHYDAVCDKDTVVNMTNHSYFNLNGEGTGSIMDHELRIDADGYTPVDEFSIPYGTVDPVEGTPFDFRTAKVIGRDAGTECEQLAHTGGYDHNFALNGSGFREVVEAYSPKTGIAMTVTTDQPGVQFYAGNFIRDAVGKGGKIYHKNDGFCLETQHFPNAVNVLAFESPRLDAGERYSTTTCYAFSVK